MSRALGVATLAAAVSACGSSTPAANSQTAGPVVRSALATSTETAAGTWVTVPMGHLDQPLNTFWQLFYRPAGAKAWSNQASALAVATNGGIVVSSEMCIRDSAGAGAGRGQGAARQPCPRRFGN